MLAGDTVRWTSKCLIEYIPVEKPWEGPSPTCRGWGPHKEKLLGCDHSGARAAQSEVTERGHGAGQLGDKCGREDAGLGPHMCAGGPGWHRAETAARPGGTLSHRRAGFAVGGRSAPRPVSALARRFVPGFILPSGGHEGRFFTWCSPRQQNKDANKPSDPAPGASRHPPCTRGFEF